MEILLSNAKLRPFVLSDAKALAIHANNPNIAQFLRDGFPSPYTIHDAETFIGHCQNTKHHNFAIDIEGEACGVIGLIYHHTHITQAELGFWLSENHWNKGIVTQAAKSMLYYGFKKMGLTRIYSFCLTNNHASKKIHDKLGFTCLGITHDACASNGKTEAFAFEYISSNYTV